MKSLTRFARTWTRVRPLEGQRRALLVLLVGLLATAAAFLTLRASERDLRRLAFERRAEELSRSLRASLERPFETLRLMPALFDGSDPVDREEFLGFVGPALARHPGVAYFEWAPEVRDEERRSFEARARAVGFKDFFIGEPGPDGKLRPASQRVRYLPLLYLVPESPGVVGLDLSFEPSRRDLALRALADQVLTVSPQFRLVEDPPDQRAVAVYAPLARPRNVSTDPRGARRGLAVLIFRVGPLVQSVLGRELESIELMITDESAPPENRVLFSSRPDLADDRSDALRYTRVFDFYTRRWATRFVAKAGTTEPDVLSPLVGGFGVLLSLAAMFVVAMFDLARRLRSEVHAAQQIGQYRLIRKLGEGGMGIVYEAEHALLRRSTAVKMISPNAVGHDAIERFEREVKATSQLTHPNTVAVYDYGRAPGGAFYYAMEFLVGATVEQLVRATGPLPPERVVHLLRQACGSLAEAHAAGLVHRDIKPANLMVCERGGVRDFVKVLDFGLVKNVRPGAHGASLGGTIVGTPQYMAPEIILGQGASAASDIYALGAVGYFMLTGTEVFATETVLGALTQHVSDTPVPPSARLGRTIPAALEALIVRCLAKSPRERPESARALARLLRACPLPEWTEEDAARFWSEHGEALRAQMREPSLTERPTHSRDTLLVDLNDRVITRDPLPSEAAPAGRQQQG